MSKRNVIIIIIVLALIVSIFAFINRSMVKDKKEVHENAEILLVKDEEKTTLGFDEIKEIGEEEFKADLKSSGNPAKEHTYTGVPLKEILKKANISLGENAQIVVRSVDGFTVALDIDEVLEDDNIYLVYNIDGESIGSKEDGGSGPYQVIIRNDQFSQRWSKYVVEIEINE